MGRRRIDVGGQVFGRLTVKNFLRTDEFGAIWECECSCGAVVEAAGYLLRRGAIKSCGCLRKEIGAASLAAHRASGAPHSQLVHGMSGTSEHTTWMSMLKRCNNPNHPFYADYGGRGIKVCDRWQSFALFIADVGMKPKPGLTLERIENSGDYEPGNVRWATRLEQAQNRRGTFRIEHDGLSLSLAEWSRRTGIKNTTIRARIRAKWPIPKALGFA